jgi:hypothetical protein
MAPRSTAQLHAWLRDHPQVRVVEPHTARPRGLPTHAAGDLNRLLQVIQDLAQAHGWTGQHTYNPDGPDSGLHVILVREVVLFAEVGLTRTALSPSQQRWVRALQATGQVEVVVWTPEDLPQIQERLCREGAPHEHTEGPTPVARAR